MKILPNDESCRCYLVFCPLLSCHARLVTIVQGYPNGDRFFIFLWKINFLVLTDRETRLKSAKTSFEQGR